MNSPTPRQMVAVAAGAVLAVVIPAAAFWLLATDAAIDRTRAVLALVGLTGLAVAALRGLAALTRT